MDIYAHVPWKLGAYPMTTVFQKNTATCTCIKCLKTSKT